MDIKFWNLWRASMLLIVIDILLFFVISIPITYLINYDFISKELVIAYGILLAFKSYILFDRHDNWKNIVDKFDELPKKIEKRYAMIFLFFIISLVGVLILEFYLMSLFRK